MATSTTSTVYIQVIEDVINKVREEFINNGGPGEGVLTELQGVSFPPILINYGCFLTFCVVRSGFDVIRLLFGSVIV